jgi:hypothetical protein
MNIFVLDEDPRIAATMMCDKHVVKMILETAQMLCSVVRKQGGWAPYRQTHARHPCTMWAGESEANWRWLLEHGNALCAEYTQRYSKRHKSQSIIDYCDHLEMNFNTQEPTPFAQAMPEEYKDENAVKAYRAYYHGEKSSFATWKINPPTWWRTNETTTNC